jgi:hypothetical protein
MAVSDGLFWGRMDPFMYMVRDWTMSVDRDIANVLSWVGWDVNVRVGQRGFEFLVGISPLADEESLF